VEKQIYVQTPALGNRTPLVTRHFGRTLGLFTA
jgi:hypothetical protein